MKLKWQAANALGRVAQQIASAREDVFRQIFKDVTSKSDTFSNSTFSSSFSHLLPFLRLYQVSFAGPFDLPIPFSFALLYLSACP